MVDVQKDGLSAVYSFFDPLLTNRSLGTFMIMDLIDMVKELQKSYLYGFYIAQSRKMAYKRFSPPECFTMDNGKPYHSLQSYKSPTT